MQPLSQQQQLELKPCSAEQQNILKRIKTNHVVVDSVAGSGKTTTNLHIAKYYKKQTILLLTYNRKLKIETREKIKLLGIKNMEVHSYHSFCVKYYKRNCFTDHGILKLLANKQKPLSKFTYDIIVLDEAQDITPTYYQLVCKILNDNEHNRNAYYKQLKESGSTKVKSSLRLCVLGDINQSIYDFNKADSRFIKYINQFLTPNSTGWVKQNLSISFRLTIPMADFVNKCLLKQDRVTAIKKGSKIKYSICDCFGGTGKTYKPAEEINHFLQLGYSYSDIFVLAPSVKSDKSPVRQLSNYLSDILEIPVYVPVSDEEQIDEDVLKGKIVFSTFHQVKGLERKVVIVFNFDNSYFQFYKRDQNPMICPNEIYVAASRASEHLSLLHHYQNDYFMFIDKTYLEQNCVFHRERLRIYKQKDNKNNYETGVTELTRHLPTKVVEKLFTFFTVKKIQEKQTHITIQTKTKQQSLYENVSEITGTAIPAYFELLKTGKMTIYPVPIDLRLANAGAGELEITLDDIRTGKNGELEIVTQTKNQKIGKCLILSSDEEDELDEVIRKLAKTREKEKREKANGKNKKETQIEKKLREGKPLTKREQDQQDRKRKKIEEVEFNKGIIDLTTMEQYNKLKETLTPPQLLRICTLWCSKKSGYHYKLNQIKSYSWLSGENLKLCYNRITTQISDNSAFELEYILENQSELVNRKLLGYVDCIDGNKLWEFKCVRELDGTHYVQLAIYAYMYLKQKFLSQKTITNDMILNYLQQIIKKSNLSIKSDQNSQTQLTEMIKQDTYHNSQVPFEDIEKSSQFFLFNILSNEIFEIECKLDKLVLMMDYLIKYKYFNKTNVPDIVFIQNMKNIYTKEKEIQKI
jgi:hypothetical protein